MTVDTNFEGYLSEVFKCSVICLRFYQLHVS